MSPHPSAQDDTQPRDVEMGDGTSCMIEVPTHRPATPDNERRAAASLVVQCSLSIAEVAAELAPVPYVGPLVKCLTAVFQAVEEQWKLLQGRCVMVLRIAGAKVTNNGQESYPCFNEGIQMLEDTLNKVQKRTHHYNEMHKVEALFKSQIISDEIEGLFVELDNCLQMFSFAADVAMEQWIRELRVIQERDAQDMELLKAELTKVVTKVDEINQKEGQVKTELTKLVTSTDEIHQNLDVIQETLQDILLAKSTVLQDKSKTTVDDYDDAKQIVRTILSVTKLQLPPELLLGRQCIVENPIPVKSGITCDIFLASFLEGEKVAKKVFRLGSADKEYVGNYAKRFMRIAKLWHEFRSDFTLPFYGVGMERFGGVDHFQLYMVSPLVKNSDSIAYLKKYRNTAGMKKNILRIITDAARGLQYLHNRDPPVVHSGMRGANVLITDSGGAVLGGFGLTKALESDESSGLLPTVMTGKSDSQRWMAPEMFEDEPLLAPPADVWSWAMTALEIISGAVPYNKHALPMTVMNKVKEGPPKREDYPAFDAYTYRPDEMWELLKECWRKDPNDRPDMDSVVATLKKIAKMPEEST